MAVLQGFPPLTTPTARVLILGSMPGAASLQATQYYAHPRNAFWPIMAALLGFDPAISYAARLARLAAANIALWDTCQACTRPGSLDTAITGVVPNDFNAFLSAHPAIAHIFFNGTASQTLFRRHVEKTLAHPLPTTRLPSTSPAHASRTIAAKLQAWRAVTAARREGGGLR